MNYVEILEHLIAIDTSVPPGNNYAEVADYLEPYFQGVGFQTQRVSIPPDQAEGRKDRVNLVCHRRLEGKPRLIFYAHMDVVPARGWDAFRPRSEAGKIYGRGAADMKGAIPALLLALESCRDRPLKYDVSVMITTDEETSQASQLRYLGQYLQPVSGARVFNLDSSFGYVSIAGLGALQMEITVRGESVHSAMAHLGENAVEKANLLVSALLELKKVVKKRKSRIGAYPDTGLTNMEARLNINMIQGGIKVNIVPDQCVISVDRRLIPEENMDDARKEIVEALSSVSDVRWDITEDITIPSVSPSDDPIIDELAGVMKEVIGEGGKYGEMGSGDLPYIVTHDWGGIEFGLGVIRSDCNIHGNDEFVYQKDIENLAEIIARFVT
jgi:succinyl-diaminopimelate desuccinylase